MNDQPKPRKIIRGVRQVAAYRDKQTEDEAFANNPLIMALPAEWEWEGENTPVMDKLTTYIPIDRDALVKMPSARRITQIAKFKLQFFQVLSRHRDLERSISLAIRFGYQGRNPAEPLYRRNLHDKLAEFDKEEPVFISAANLGFALLGSPGLGKSISVARILRLNPQVIYHEGPELHHTQIVWLFLTCSHDKSTRGLCLIFFQEIDAILGSHYHDEYSGENESDLIAGMATVAANLSLGILIIDEIQFLSARKSGGKDDMLKFLVQLQNTLGIPVVLIGTHRAGKIIAGTPYQARRSVGMGGQSWSRLPMQDPEWDLFQSALWQNQFLKNRVELTTELALAFYEESQGFFNYAVDLYYFAQLDAINNGTETLTVDSIEAAAKSHMEFNRPYINALKSGNALFAEALEDIVACDYEDQNSFFQEQLLLPPIPSQTDKVKTPSRAQRAISSAVQGDGAINPFQPAAPKLPAEAPATTIPKRRKRKLLGYPAGSIMAICDEGISVHKISPYEALKKAGLIRSVAEFLPVMAVA